jgi:hypothetical protein
MTAVETAIGWDPVPAGYHLKLGEYCEAAGRDSDARAAYFEALRRDPDLGSSGFWTDPAHPKRAAILAEAVAHFADDAEIGLHLAIEAGDLDTATEIALGLDGDAASDDMRRELAYWAALVDDERIAPCPACYYDAVRQLTAAQLWQDYVFLAELALQGDGIAHPLDLTAEQAARAALFISEGQAARSWYVLAQLAERAGADDQTINAMLVRAVPPLTTPLSFGLAVYGRVAAFDALPGARTPSLSRRECEPWLWLADRFEAARTWGDARRVYEALLMCDPYQWELRRRLAALPQ